MPEQTPKQVAAELRRRANFPSDVPERAFLVGIRHLMSTAADLIDKPPVVSVKDVRYVTRMLDREKGRCPCGGFDGKNHDVNPPCDRVRLATQIMEHVKRREREED